MLAPELTLTKKVTVDKGGAEPPFPKLAVGRTPEVEPRRFYVLSADIELHGHPGGCPGCLITTIIERTLSGKARINAYKDRPQEWSKSEGKGRSKENKGKSKEQSRGTKCAKRLHKGETSKTGLSNLENSKSETNSETQESAQTCPTDNYRFHNVWCHDAWSDHEWNDGWSSVGWHDG